LTPLQAVRRHIALVLVPILVFVGAAVAYAQARTPVYSSDAQLNVGGVNLTVQSIPGYAVAVTQLAVAYSRAADATPVVRVVARRTRMKPDAVVQSVSVTPVERSPVIRVDARAKTATKAERLANAEADVLASYARTLNRTNPDTKRLLRRYVADSSRVSKATAALGNAKTSDDRDRARTRLAVARLEQQTDQFLYQQSKAGDATTSLVRKLAAASPAQSDRASVMQRAILAALLAGLLVGVGLAIARSESEMRRRLSLR
jgi:capsular polysaccharide biosynthesis protein